MSRIEKEELTNKDCKVKHCIAKKLLIACDYLYNYSFQSFKAYQHASSV
jgi:hypothetical protein